MPQLGLVDTVAWPWRGLSTDLTVKILLFNDSLLFWLFVVMVGTSMYIIESCFVKEKWLFGFLLNKYCVALRNPPIG